jgi:S-formylglutathione hydrolase FrmB
MRPGLSLLVLILGASPAVASFEVLRPLQGRLLDLRIRSHHLQQTRDLQVYLPPGYIPCRSYPLILWLHGGASDERSFRDLAQLAYLDDQMARGLFPPAIVACPDGTIPSLCRLNPPHSLYLNGPHGRFADHVMQEVIPFLTTRYRIRPEREAHAIIGLSAGGFGAANLALKHRDYFGSMVSISGGLNQLYHTRQGDYFAPFDPCTYRSRAMYASGETLVYFLGGMIRLSARQLWDPVFGSQPGILERIRAENPADLLCSTNLRPGELNLYVGYGARDPLNMAAHAESFAWLARQRGVTVTCHRDEEGGHDRLTLRRLHRAAYPWLAQQLLW